LALIGPGIIEQFFLTEAVFQKQIKRETNKFKANFDRNDLLSIDDLGSLKHPP
jgi:hypothetical protein